MFIYLFSIFGCVPYISVNKKKVFNRNIQIGTSIPSMKFLFSNKNEVNSFLLNMFVENWNLFVLDDFLFFDKLKNNTSKTFSDKQKFNLTIPSRLFFELNYFSSNILNDLEAFNIKVKFLFSNKNFYNFDLKKLIKNFPLFWISG